MTSHFGEYLLSLVRKPDRITRQDGMITAAWDINLPSGRVVSSGVQLLAAPDAAALKLLACPFTIGANETEALFRDRDVRDLYGLEPQVMCDWTAFT